MKNEDIKILRTKAENAVKDGLDCDFIKAMQALGITPVDNNGNIRDILELYYEITTVFNKLPEDKNYQIANKAILWWQLFRRNIYIK